MTFIASEAILLARSRTLAEVALHRIAQFEPFLVVAPGSFGVTAYIAGVGRG